MARVVDATGYVTVAEREIDPASAPNSTPAVLWPVSLSRQRRAGMGN